MATNTEFKPLDDEAALYLSEDIESAKTLMAEIDVKIQGYQAEIDALRAKRRAAEFKINVLSQVAGTATETANKTLPKRHHQESGVVAAADAQVNSVGFRQTILDVLRDARGGMKPKDVAAKLLEKGVSYTATTDINVRVGNDLYRLANTSGQVKKRGKLYYFSGDALNGEHLV